MNPRIFQICQKTFVAKHMSNPTHSAPSQAEQEKYSDNEGLCEDPNPEPHVQQTRAKQAPSQGRKTWTESPIIKERHYIQPTRRKKGPVTDDENKGPRPRVPRSAVIALQTERGGSTRWCHLSEKHALNMAILSLIHRHVHTLLFAPFEWYIQSCVRLACSLCICAHCVKCCVVVDRLSPHSRTLREACFGNTNTHADESNVILSMKICVDQPLRSAVRDLSAFWFLRTRAWARLW